MSKLFKKCYVKPCIRVILLNEGMALMAGSNKGPKVKFNVTVEDSDPENPVEIEDPIEEIEDF